MICEDKFSIGYAIRSFEKNLHRLTLIEEIKLRDWCRELGPELIIWAIEQAVKINCRTFRYVNKILIYYRENIEENMIESIPV